MRAGLLFLLTLSQWTVFSCRAFVVERRVVSPFFSRTTTTTTRTSVRRDAVAVPPPSSSTDAPVLGPHIAIDENFPGIHKVHTNPNIYVLENFLDLASCRDMVQQASTKNMAQSPVAYAGWTQDFQDLFELAAKGPVAWAALLTAWWQVKNAADASTWQLVSHALQNYGIFLLLATAAIVAFTKSRADGLQELRTSTSTTLDDMQASVGARRFVQQATQLFDATVPPHEAASYFEAPTIIRYEAGQQLAPHFDANRSASVEDANRGGQTLATLIVYLNDVSQGGLTRFGRLSSSPSGSSSGNDNNSPLTVQPKAGDALLFFPADAAGRFDERTEHEGCPAVDEKWIARIWRHEALVPPPFGLAPPQLARLED